MKGKAEEAKNKAGVWELASRKRQQDKSQKFEENYISMTVALDAMHESKITWCLPQGVCSPLCSS